MKQNSEGTDNLTTVETKSNSNSSVKEEHTETISSSSEKTTERDRKRRHEHPTGFGNAEDPQHGRTFALTFGAMIVAIFGVLLLLNRQTGGILEEVFVFVFPIPMVAYGARYGWKKSLPVFVCTVFISILCGTFSGFFYAVSASVVGMVFGDCLYRKRDPGKTLALVIVLSVVSNLLSSVVLAGLFGINLTAEMNEMRKAMLDAAQSVSESGLGSGAAGTGVTSGDSGASGTGGTVSLVDQLSSIVTPEYLMRVFIIANVVLGVVQGIVIYELSLLILRKLKFKVQRPRRLSEFSVPKWSGILALVCFLFYYGYAARPFGGEMVNGIIQTIGLCAYMYLVCFGAYGSARFLRHRFGLPKAFAVVIAALGMMIAPIFMAIIGFDYISLHLKERIAGEA